MHDLASRIAISRGGYIGYARITPFTAADGSYTERLMRPVYDEMGHLVRWTTPDSAEALSHDEALEEEHAETRRSLEDVR